MENMTINSPKEMAFRFTYVVFVTLSFSVVYYFICLLIDPTFFYSFMLLVSGSLTYGIRYLGVKYLEFRRLDKSALSDFGGSDSTKYQEFEKCLDKLENKMDSWERQELRNEIRERLEDEETYRRYAPSLRNKHPYLLKRSKTFT